MKPAQTAASILILISTATAAVPPEVRKIKIPQSASLSAEPLNDGDIVFISLEGRFSLAEPEPGQFPEVVGAKGTIIPSQFEPRISVPKFRMQFDKNFAPPHGSIKKVNPAADRGERLYLVQHSENGAVVLIPAQGSWNDFGPPVRKITFTDPKKKKLGAKLNSKDLAQMLSGAARVSAGNKHVKKLLETWRQVMKTPPQEAVPYCPDEKPEPVQETPPPPVAVQEPAPPEPTPHSIIDEPEEELRPKRRRIEPSPPPPPLTRSQIGLIEDKLKPIVELSQKSDAAWREGAQFFPVLDYLREKKENGELLSIDEMKALDIATKRTEELMAQENQYVTDKNNQMDQICSMFPGHCGEVWDLFWKQKYPNSDF